MNTTARAAELQELLRCLESLALPFIASGDASKPAPAAASNESNGSALPKPETQYSNAAAGITPAERTGILDLHPPAELEKLLDLDISASAGGKERLAQQIEQVLKFSVNTWDQGFMDKLYSATNPVGVIAETLLAILNTNVHVYQVSPVLTLIEKAVTRLLARLVGFTGDHAGGIAQPGGSASNHTSVIIARNTLYPETKETGIGSRQWRIFTSAHGHYSVEKAAQMFGFGTSSVVPVPVDEDGKMIPAELERLVVESKQRGETPFYVNATAGTTVLGAYDPFVDIAAVCARQKLWFHVDGSWGGGVVFSPNLKKGRMEGVELADSVALTPHKMAIVPLTSSFLVLKDTREAWRAMRVNAGYLFHTDLDGDSPEIYDLGELTPQCGRRGDALKLFLSLQYYGLEHYTRIIESAFARAQKLYETLKASPKFKVVTPKPPQCLQVCFYYQPEDDSAVDSALMTKRTAAIADRMVAQGWMLDYAPGLKGKGMFFRPVINVNLRDETVEMLVPALEKVGAEVVAEGK